MSIKPVGGASAWNCARPRSRAGTADPAGRGARIPLVFRYHVLRREQRLPRPPGDVFPFFADARNLEAITPPWLGFRVLTPAPIELRAGALIEYRLRLHGLPLTWLTRIEDWTPGVRFATSSSRARTGSGTTRTSSPPTAPAGR